MVRACQLDRRQCAYRCPLLAPVPSRGGLPPKNISWDARLARWNGQYGAPTPLGALRAAPRRIFSEALHEAFLPGERRFSREHLEQHAAETIGIASPIELFVAHQLFGA